MVKIAARKAKKPVVLKAIPKGVPLLAFDPSSSVIGWSYFIDRKLHGCGRIKCPASWDSPKRIESNTREAEELVFELASDTKPMAVLEWNSHKSAARCPNAQGLAVLGQAQGALWWMLLKHELVSGVERISERLWSRQGGRNVSKETRFNHVRMAFPDYAKAIEEDPGFDPGRDVADAIGIAWWRLSIKG